MTSPGKAQVVGTGLIGASIALGLRGQGWHVTGIDTDAGRAEEALRRGVIVVPAGEDGSLISATPALTIEDAELEEALERLSAT